MGHDPLESCPLGAGGHYGLTPNLPWNSAGSSRPRWISGRHISLLQPPPIWNPSERLRHPVLMKSQTGPRFIYNEISWNDYGYWIRYHPGSPHAIIFLNWHSRKNTISLIRPSPPFY